MIEIQCPDCLGKKVWNVKTPSGDEFTIPCNTCELGYQCYGTISIYVESAVVTPLTIGSIQTDSNDGKNPIRYMCEETGIGSGSLYNECDLFADRTDALDHATEKAKTILKEKEKEEEKRISYRRKKSRRNPIKK